MPLIILTGFPCSGLTHRAQQLASALESIQTTLPASKPRYKINVVSTHDASSHPRTVYDRARTEKEARGVAYTRAKRLLGKDSFVILDGMNYIKGYRSTSAHPFRNASRTNEARIHRQEEHSNKIDPNEVPNDESATTTTTDTTEPYPPELLQNLIFRYEEPSTHSRWDKPLFTVPWADVEPPVADIWSALTGIPYPSISETDKPSTLASSFAARHISSFSSPSSTAAASKAGSLTKTPRVIIQPHQATKQPISTDSSALYNMEKQISAIISAIRTFTLSTPSAEAALSQDANGIQIAVPEASIPIFIPAHTATSGTTDELAGAGGILALPRLQRLRRQWISLNRAYITGRHTANAAGGIGSGQVGDAFVRFLNAEFGNEEE
ncbi:putative RNA polymerase II Elongator complex associated protein Kti12 [Aspergillus affinis]|uniref:putative RNA polymerase II Elongator complex associated protein Kti12 n=1 Tax=Aspergillus affinis TaxID=1070780 RepID=UPI0022FEFD22|nr:putative RNA polymerase II Elongator complex associated protein Kti12 [Aspergillus affinis]KAI9040707.1 putative RNA polymerase II Elongator complex associated protein Kti12 [Aspergillus affinis]